MNWYFNNHGLADGPHDEPEMRAQVKRGVVNGKTLVWQPEMESWQETAPLNPAWWQTKVAPPPKVLAAPPTEGLRRPVPMAPIGAKESSKFGSFFKKLFRGGGKS